MLADDTFGIFAVRTCFASESGRVPNVADGQLLFRNNLIHMYGTNGVFGAAGLTKTGGRIGMKGVTVTETLAFFAISSSVFLLVSTERQYWSRANCMSTRSPLR